MEIIKTDSFQLAIITSGDKNANKLAIVIPGRLDTKDYAQNPSHIKYLASKGYFAMSFDPPGSWDSPGGLELYSTTNNIKAVNELIEYFGNKPTLLMGHSRGGTVAMLAGPKNDHVTHMVSVNSSSGGPIDVDKPVPGKSHPSLRDLPPGTERTKEQKRFDLPYHYFEDSEQYNALDGLKACNKPKLFFYGTQDVLTTANIVKHMYDVAAEPKMIHDLDTEHDYRLHAEIIDEVNKVVGEFLDKYDYSDK
jgi:pimeloyl-ACP methyl ester carboxylesterase